MPAAAGPHSAIMDRSAPGITPLRQRMLEDMHLRKLEPKTQTSYIRAVRRLAAFLERSPDSASAEDFRRFQLHLVDQGSSPITLNATITGLKFFLDARRSRRWRS
jgi:integrase/recombinase XerD